MHTTRLIGLTLAMTMAAGCRSQSPAPAANHWVETQLFFGLTEPGRRIPDADWHDFVDRTITPRFPDGFTLLYGDGQYRSDDGAVHKEPSAVLVLLHPPGDDLKLTDIAREYDRRFHQQSVLRADVPAEASFISTSPPLGFPK